MSDKKIYTLGAELERGIIDDFGRPVFIIDEESINRFGSERQIIKFDVGRNQLEIASPVYTSLKELENSLVNFEKILFEDVTRRGYILHGSGVSPFMRYDPSFPFNSYQTSHMFPSSRKFMQIFASQFHIGTDDENELIRLYNLYGKISHVVQALSCSAPICQGKDYKLSSIRPFLVDETYEDMLTIMYGGIPVVRSINEYVGLLSEVEREINSKINNGSWHLPITTELQRYRKAEGYYSITPDKVFFDLRLRPDHKIKAAIGHLEFRTQDAGLNLRQDMSIFALIYGLLMYLKNLPKEELSTVPYLLNSTPSEQHSEVLSAGKLGSRLINDHLRTILSHAQRGLKLVGEDLSFLAPLAENISSGRYQSDTVRRAYEQGRLVGEIRLRY